MASHYRRLFFVAYPWLLHHQLGFAFSHSLKARGIEVAVILCNQVQTLLLKALRQGESHKGTSRVSQQPERPALGMALKQSAARPAGSRCSRWGQCSRLWQLRQQRQKLAPILPGAV